MSKIPSSVVKRLTSTVPKFKKILAKAKERDVNESDTVTIITDMLEEIFGFDKYSEITREFAIQGRRAVNWRGNLINHHYYCISFD